MQGIVYVDVLVLLNAIVGYFLLRCTSKLAALPCRGLRLCGASFLAGISALTLLWQNAPLLLSLTGKGAAVALVVFIAFPWCGARSFFKGLLWYIALNAALGGVLFLAVLAGAKNIYVRGFSFYLHVSPLLLIFCVLGMYALVQGGSLLLGRLRPGERLEFVAELQGAPLSGIALLDTGQQIRDGFTGDRAILCSLPGLRAQLPVPVRAQLEAYFTDGCLLAAEPAMRLIPVQTATGVQALPAMRAREFRAKTGARAVREPLLVFTREALEGGAVSALVNPEILQEK